MSFLLDQLAWIAAWIGEDQSADYVLGLVRVLEPVGTRKETGYETLKEDLEAHAEAEHPLKAYPVV